MKTIIKFFRPLIIIGLNTLSFIIRPKMSGAKAIIIYNNQILLITTTYQFGYTLPGGGLKGNETPEEAVRRETMEEVGIELGDITPLPSFITYENYKQDTVHSFYGEVTSPNYRLDLFEIDTAKWYPINNLPEVEPVTAKILQQYIAQVKH